VKDKATSAGFDIPVAEDRAAYISRGSFSVQALTVILSLSVVCVVFVERHAPWELGFVAICGLVLLYSLLRNLLSETRISDRGVRHRTWYGKTVFSPFSEVTALELKGRKILLTVQGLEVSLDKSNSNIPQVSELLQQRVAKYIVT
jgi:hypothetical protein